MVPSTVEDEERIEFMIQFVRETASNFVARKGFHENDAAVWIATKDPARLPLPPTIENQNVLLERWYLVTLYFATEGANWYHQVGFLTTDDACSWNDGSRRGVFCGTGALEGRVTSILLRKFFFF